MTSLKFKSSMKKPAGTPQSAGFSLAELLVVISVIAIIGGVALPSIVNVTRSADQATKLRNAQNIAATYNLYAEAFYAVNNAYPSNTLEAAIGLMANGTSVTNNRLNVTNFFRLPGIVTTEIATNKLTLVGNQIVFDPEAP